MGPTFPHPEFFLHINMDEVLLWTVHSSRNDRCRIKLQNSPTWHSLHSPPINKHVLVLLSRKTVFITALLSNIWSCSSPPLRAYTILHIPFSPLMGSTIVSANVIYLNSSRNIWGTSGWSSVLSRTLRCYRNGLLLIPRNSCSFSLAGINYSMPSLWYPTYVGHYALRQKATNITNICPAEILEGCSSLYSSIQPNLCFDPCLHCLFSCTPFSVAWILSPSQIQKSLCFLTITYPVFNQQLKTLHRREMTAEPGFQRWTEMSCSTEYAELHQEGINACPGIKNCLLIQPLK